MKNYTITVNGNTYEVAVEERTADAANNVTNTNKVSIPVQTPKKEVPAPKAVSAGGNIKIEAPMTGKVLAVKKAVGESVKKGEAVIILEAMKMENEIVAPEDGVVASINVSAGEAVETAQILATLN